MPLKENVSCVLPNGLTFF